MFPGPDSTRTGIASYRGIALVMQRVVGNVKGTNDRPHLGVGPGSKRIELKQSKRVIEFFLCELGARNGLVAMLAGQPRRMALKRASQRLDLSDATTSLAQIDAFIEGELAMPGHVLQHSLGIRLYDTHVQTVSLRDAVDHFYRLRMKPTRIERKDLYGQARLDNGVSQHHVLSSQ